MAIIMFMANDFIGPQMASIGLAQSLQKCGHQIYFCIKRESFQRFLNENFNETNFLELYDDNNLLFEKKSIDFLIEKIQQYGFVTNLSPLDKVKQIKKVNLIQSNFEEPLNLYNKQIENYLIKIQPDLIVYDGEIIPPSILFWSGCPWIYLFCSNPIGLFDSNDLPPFLSDFYTYDKNNWNEFRSILDECYYKQIRITQSKLCQQLLYPNPNDIDWMCNNRFFIRSPYLNIYQFPKELDYDDIIEISDQQYCRVDSFCRQQSNYLNDKDIEKFLNFTRKNNNDNEKLIYFSLGSMGSCNLDLMTHLIDIFSKTKHKFLISTGPLNDQLKLSDNMLGQSYMPQIWIFSNLNIDLAIIHGGNNSLCEAFTYGIPCLILPLFYDQFLNARRIEEKKLGSRIDPFKFDDDDFIYTLNQLLNDNQLRSRMKSIFNRINNDNSKLNCCKRLEELIIQFKTKNKK